MAKATADPSRDLTLYFRINRDGSFTFNCVDSDGNAFALTDYTIVANFKRQANDSTPFLQLTNGSGITKNASSFILTMTKANAAKFREQSFFLEVVRTKDGLEKNWIAGEAIFHNGKFDGVASDAATLTINDGDQVISLVISAGGSSFWEIETRDYDPELLFDKDQVMEFDAEGEDIVLTLAASGHVNGVGIILRLNKPDSVTFPADSEAHSSSAAIDPTKINEIILRYDASWFGEPRVIYLNSLFAAV